MAPDPNLPSIDQVRKNLQSLPMVIDNPEFVSPEGSAPVTTATLDNSALTMRKSTVAKDHFADRSHRQLCDAVNDTIKPGDVGDVEGVWRDAFTSLQQGYETFDDKIGAAIRDKWHGVSADRAVDSITKYVNSAYNLVASANLVGRQLALLSESMTNTQQGMPQEPSETFMGKVAGVFGAHGWDDDRRNDAKNNAVTHLNNVYYGGGIQATDGNLPQFPAVHNPTSTTTDDGGGIPSGTSAGPGTSASPSGPGTTDNPSTQNPNATTDPNSSGNQSTGSNNGKTTGNGQSATQSSADGGPQTTASGYDPSGGSGGGAGGAGSGAGTLTDPSLSGGRQQQSAAAASAGRAGAAAGSAGMPGMGSPGKGKKEEDKDHKSAEYLRGEHLKKWLYGEVDKLSPSVLGFDENGKPLT